MEFVIVLAVLAVVVLVVGGPLRRAYGERGRGVGSTRIAELEATQEAKYREIRDAELDHRTGKLSDADFEALDRTLRGEAVEVMHELDRARGGQR